MRNYENMILAKTARLSALNYAPADVTRKLTRKKKSFGGVVWQTKKTASKEPVRGVLADDTIRRAVKIQKPPPIHRFSHIPPAG